MYTPREKLRDHFDAAPLAFETPLPEGRDLTRAERDRVLDLIAARFIDADPAAIPGSARTYTLYKVRGTVSDASAPGLLGPDAILIVEGSDIMRAMDPQAFVTYVNSARQPWESFDYYLFDDAITRCVCYTHDEEWYLFDAGS